MKTDGRTRTRAARSGRVATVCLVWGATASWLLASPSGLVVLHPGATARLPVWLVGATLLAGGLALAFRALDSGRTVGSAGWRSVYGVLAVYLGGLLLLGGLLYPAVVPPSITVHSAASPHSALLFLIIGVGIFIPIILTYQSYGYWVFRGRPDAHRESEAQPRGEVAQ